MGCECPPMKRDLNALASNNYDLVVVGGGIFGICTAWDAVLRGLKVALIERDDFAHATSANCYKMVHGGIRYLQHGDLVRVRESARERSILLRIAPHLVEPLPIVVPTSGYGKNGKALLRTAMLVYELLTADRNRGINDPDRRIPPARVMSRTELLDHFPGLDGRTLTGAVLFHDAQMYSPPRLAIAFLRAAAAAGVDAANYVEAIGLVQQNGSVKAVHARDARSGDELEIRGRAFVNAAGPWAERVLMQSVGKALTPPCTFSRDAFFVVPRRLESPYTLALQARNRDPDALLSREARHLFIVPWRDYNIIGVWHLVYRDDPDSVDVSERDLQQFVDEINEAYPAFNLKVDEVTLWNAGLVLFGEQQSDAVNLSYGKRSRLVDHAESHRVDNLISLIGIRYTMARSDAKRAVDLVIKKLGVTARPCRTATTEIYGGGFERFDALLGRVRSLCPELSEASIGALARNHGGMCEEVLKPASESTTRGRCLPESHVTEAEVAYAAREEMVMKLSDIVFRRTDLGTGGHPGRAALEQCARLAGRELGWNETRARQEVGEVDNIFRQRCSVPTTNAMKSG